MNFCEVVSPKNNPDTYERLFNIGMWWRIIYGVMRIVIGVMLLQHIGTPFLDLFYSLVGKDLIEDPDDILLKTVAPILEHTSFTVTYFLATYIIFFGVIDVVLSICLLKHKMWAFPTSMYLIAGFVAYEIYRFTHTHSLVLAYIIIVDIVVIWLIKKEYDNLRAAQIPLS